MRRVSRYGTGGWLEDLPSMNLGRADHGCASFLQEGEKVSAAPRPPPPHRVSCAAQVFIVSGVFGASSEVLRAGAWTLVAPLPAPVTGVRGAALANTVYMMGNCSSARSLTTAHCPQVASTATRTSTTTSGATMRPPRPGRRPAPCSSPGASTQSASCRAGRSHSSVTDTDAGHSRGLVICSNKDENTDVMHLMLCVKYAVQIHIIRV